MEERKIHYATKNNPFYNIQKERKAEDEAKKKENEYTPPHYEVPDEMNRFFADIAKLPAFEKQVKKAIAGTHWGHGEENKLMADFNTKLRELKDELWKFVFKCSEELYDPSRYRRKS